MELFNMLIKIFFILFSSFLLDACFRDWVHIVPKQNLLFTYFQPPLTPKKKESTAHKQNGHFPFTAHNQN